MPQVGFDASFKIRAKIGSGSFGRVFEAIHSTTGEEVAIKIEHKKNEHLQLIYEGSLYKNLLEKDPNPKGIPKVYQCTSQSDYNLMVMELLGSSLEDLFNMCGRKLSLKTVLLIADQMLQRMEFVHSCGIIHRDIKPENFVMGIGKKQDILYIIDFGLAKSYIKEGKHIECMKGKKLVGTMRYASINTHKGYSQSRRDDLESIGYVLIYFLKGSLPWQGIKGDQKQQRYDKIRDKKIETSIAALCQGLPDEFAQYLAYVKKLRFDETPNYQQLREMFRGLYLKRGFKDDLDFDWRSKSLDLDSTTNDSRHHLELPQEGPKLINNTTNLRPIAGDGKAKLHQNLHEIGKTKACFSVFNCFA